MTITVNQSIISDEAIDLEAAQHPDAPDALLAARWRSGSSCCSARARSGCVRKATTLPGMRCSMFCSNAK